MGGSPPPMRSSIRQDRIDGLFPTVKPQGRPSSIIPATSFGYRNFGVGFGLALYDACVALPPCRYAEAGVDLGRSARRRRRSA